MIMNDEKQSMASAILSKMKDGKVKDQEIKPNADMGDDEGLKSAMEDLLQAISDKDPHGMLLAFKAALSLVDPDEEQDPE